MKKSIFILLILICGEGNAQVDLNKITVAQWQQDLDHLFGKIEKRFAGFTPELKEKFAHEASNLRDAMGSLTVNQRIVEMARLLALLNDGHTEISLTGSGTGFSRFPLVLYYFGEELKVIAASPQFKHIIGLSVNKIGEIPVSTVFEKLKPYMNKDNDIEYITTAPILMTIPEVLNGVGILNNTTEATFTFITKDGKDLAATIPSVSREYYNRTEFERAYEKTPMYLENLNEGYWFRYLPDSKVMYINFITLFNQDGNSSIKKVIGEALKEIDKHKPSKLVVDFRLCRGGNYSHITPLLNGIKKRPYLNSKGKLYVINGRMTFSAAAVATLFFKDETQAIVVGEISRARPNWAENMESFDLPNTKLNYDYTNKIKVHSAILGNDDKIPVDVEINRSFEHYRHGLDEVMEYILSQKEYH